MLTRPRRNLMSTFLINISVLWFGAAFITEGDLLTKMGYVANMIVSLGFALYLKK